MSLGGKIGSSDHCVLSCQPISLAPVKRRRTKIFSKKKATELIDNLFGQKEFDKKESNAQVRTDHEIFELEPISFFREVSNL